MIIYRIEKETARREGPYRGRYIGRPALEYDVDKHPPPDKDGIPYDIMNNHRYYCGFESYDSLQEWFDGSDLLTLKTEGYIGAVYDTHDYYLGGRQVMFHMDNSDRIAVFDIVFLRERPIG